MQKLTQTADGVGNVAGFQKNGPGFLLSFLLVVQLVALDGRSVFQILLPRHRDRCAV